MTLIDTARERLFVDFALPPLAERTVLTVLTEQARLQPDKPAVADDERSLTYEQLLHASSRLAAGFAAAGVAPGESVVTMLGNHLDAVLTWLGLTLAGAHLVPVSPDLRGLMLEHVLRDSGTRRAVIEAPLLAQLRQASAAVGVDIAPIIRTASDDPAVAGPEGPVLLSNVATFDGELAVHNDGWDVMALMYTSGTTGLSKGVPTTEAHAYGYASPCRLADGRSERCRVGRASAQPCHRAVFRCVQRAYRRCDGTRPAGFFGHVLLG